MKFTYILNTMIDYQTRDFKDESFKSGSYLDEVLTAKGKKKIIEQIIYYDVFS
jgi:hypothetical protein